MTRRIYTPELANRTLPLVRSIARSVRETAREMEETWKELEANGAEDSDRPPALAERARDIHERFSGLIKELEGLGVDLKDPFAGLLDFRAHRDGREVYLCWRLGEDSVRHWHELEAGFPGRQPIETL